MNRIGLTMAIKSSLLALLLGCSTSFGASDISFGLVSMDGDGNALLVTSRPVPATATIHLQFADAQSQAQCCKRLRGSDLQVSTEQVVAVNKQSDAKPLLYRAKVPGDWAELPFVGAAVFGDISAVKGGPTHLLVTGRDGIDSRADLCLSREGVHLIEKKSGKVAAHLYLSLGYDLEAPTCR